MQCRIGQGVTGIATRDAAHQARYKAELEARHIHAFLESIRWQIAALTLALGHDDVRALCRDDLMAATMVSVKTEAISMA